jgi:hypothetical protein
MKINMFYVQQNFIWQSFCLLFWFLKKIINFGNYIIRVLYYNQAVSDITSFGRSSLLNFTVIAIIINISKNLPSVICMSIVYVFMLLLT